MVRYRRGGILGLLTLPRDHWEAIEYDLADRGFVLADVPGRVTWRAVRALVRYAKPDSAIAVTSSGDVPVWDRLDYRLADILDVLAYQTWLFKKVKFKGAGKAPKPVPRPGDVSTERHFGAAEMTTAEINAWLARLHAAPPASLPPTEVLT